MQFLSDNGFLYDPDGEYGQPIERFGPMYDVPGWKAANPKIVPGAKAGSYARVYAIVESKGNWHKELFTAMEMQLRDRYLKHNRCQSGVYLVGWFSCPKWDDWDSRSTRCPSMSMNDARSRLEHQANELSTGAYDIRTYVVDCSLP